MTHRRRLRFALLAWVAAGALVLTACSSASKSSTTTSAASATGSRTKLSWKACYSSAQCATLQVPLDNSKPAGEQIDVALIRYPATGKRVGSLLLNPGGPGASGVEFLRSVGRDIVSPEIAKEYDLVSWDPRGTGETLPVQCGDRLDYLFDGVTYAPRNADQVAKLKSVTDRFVAACRSGMGNKLEFIGSRDTILDMERIRVALGENKLNYLGFSYGTYLGAEYAAQHPDRVGRFVLDGAVDPALQPLQAVTQQSVGFDKGLDAFFASCGAKTKCTYADGSTPRDAYLALRSRIDTKAIPAAFGQQLGPAQFDTGVATLLYSGSAGWSTLASALNAAATGDGEPLFQAFSEYVDRSGSGKYSTQYPAFLAIGCVDGPALGTFDQTIEIARGVGVKAPYFGETGVNYSLPCTMWPVPPTGAPGAVSAPNAQPSLVVGTTGDPATPVAWAQSLAAQLGSARLVTAPGEQHTAYGQGNTCVDDTVNRYFLSGTVPGANLTCPA